MQYGLLAHVIVAFFMYSNTAIFSDDDVLNSSTGLDSEDAFFQNLFSAESRRLRQPHAKIYCGFMVIFVVLFTGQKIVEWVMNSVFDHTEMTCEKACRKMRKVKKGSGDIIEMLSKDSYAFSNNILEEMTIDDLKKEY